MADKDNRKSVVLLTLTLTLLIATFITVTYLQFTWIRTLQTKYQFSQSKVLNLKTTCMKDKLKFTKGENKVPFGDETIQTVMASLSRQDRATSSSLQQLLTDMMNAQERILLSHCLNTTGLCHNGAKGQHGVKGDRGLPGTQGQAGTQGPDGIKGDVGPPGINGTKGTKGIKGDHGLLGFQGMRGSVGPKGSQGIQGPKGSNGTMGITGAKGAIGVKGNSGAIGPTGKGGPRGMKGDKGYRGEPGYKGETGPKGPVGPPGDQLQKNCLCIKPPTIDVFQPNVTLPALSPGSRVNLVCDSHTIPAPNITWTTPASANCPAHTHAGSTLNVTSLGPSQAGRYTCTASNAYGTISKYIDIKSNFTNILDCNFEHRDTCDWMNSGDFPLHWTLHQGPTQTPNTGPSTDHTMGGKGGTYVYLESSAGLFGEKAALISPELPPSAKSCLTFWYHMLGSQINKLEVETRTCTGETLQHLTMHGPQGNIWQKAEVQIPAFNKDHVISIVATRGNGVLGDIAVDDIHLDQSACKNLLSLNGPANVDVNRHRTDSLTLHCDITGYPKPTYTWTKQGACSPLTYTGQDLSVTKSTAIGDAGTYTCSNAPGHNYTQTFHVTVNSTASNGNQIPDQCTFDKSKNATDLCGWSQVTGSDSFNWDLHSGPTQSSMTGPDTDHTQGTVAGKYLYTEASSPRKEHEFAVLESHSMPANREACLSMYYHMYGSGIGTLKVDVKDLCNNKHTRLLTLSGEHGNSWHKADIAIPAAKVAQHEYVIQIRGEIGNNYYGDIGIDDLVIKDHPCTVTTATILGDCSFEIDMCGWSQSGTDDFDWLRLTGATDSTGTGPTGDHTKPDGSGFYIYIESSNPRIEGNKADLLSPTLPGGSEYCFHLATSMYGDTMGNISIKIQDTTTSNPKPITLVTYSKADPTPAWHQRNVNIPAQPNTFKIMIEGVRGSAYTGDAAIDDVSVTQGKCT